MTPAQSLRVILSARYSGARLAEQPPLQPVRAADDGTTVTVDPESAFQVVLGFGGAFTEAAALTWLALRGREREALLRAYFDPAHGHGYTLCRVPIGSCDFALGNYAHVETPLDTQL